MTSSKTYSSTKSFSTSFLLLLLSLLLQAICSAQTTNTNIFYEHLELQSPPQDCHKLQRLTSTVDESDDAYRLMVDLPKAVSRKNLNVDIDYEQGTIQVFGWWMEQKVRGERPKKMCAYQEWSVDFADLEGDDYSLFDLVMELEEHKVIVSLPKKLEQDEGTEPVVEYENSTYAVAKNLWKMVRGLARLNSSLHNNSTYSDDNDNEFSAAIWGSAAATALSSSRELGNHSSMQYLRSRQDALERFLKFSLGVNDEESYWLKKM